MNSTFIKEIFSNPLSRIAHLRQYFRRRRNSSQLNHCSVSTKTVAGITGVVGKVFFTNIGYDQREMILGVILQSVTSPQVKPHVVFVPNNLKYYFIQALKESGSS